MAKLLDRTDLARTVERALARAPITLLLGPRQCGKTTLARQLAATRRTTWFDLEDPETPLRAETAKQVLEPLRGLVVIDELQRLPELFPLLRVLADRRPLPARFLILGSASPNLVRGASETLAGRVAQCEMAGFGLGELGPAQQTKLWTRGGYPRSTLARTDPLSFAWRADFVQTFLERDLFQLGIRIPAPAMRRFWTMLAHYHGQTWNAAELARAVGTGEAAVRNHLDILTAAFMVRQLPPWFENVGKRLVKAPKVYVRDTGLLHYLLGLHTRLEVLGHPKLGASWEGFAVDEVIRSLDAERDAYFYATHSGAELDLLIVRGSRRFGFEMKVADAPAATRSMHVVLEDIGLERLFVVHPGTRSYELQDRISALALRDLPDARKRWKLG